MSYSNGPCYEVYPSTGDILFIGDGETYFVKPDCLYYTTSRAAQAGLSRHTKAELASLLEQCKQKRVILKKLRTWAQAEGVPGTTQGKERTNADREHFFRNHNCVLSGPLAGPPRKLYVVFPGGKEKTFYGLGLMSLCNQAMDWQEEHLTGTNPDG